MKKWQVYRTGLAARLLVPRRGTKESDTEDALILLELRDMLTLIFILIRPTIYLALLSSSVRSLAILVRLGHQRVTMQLLRRRSIIRVFRSWRCRIRTGLRTCHLWHVIRRLRDRRMLVLCFLPPPHEQPADDAQND